MHKASHSLLQDVVERLFMHTMGQSKTWHISRNHTTRPMCTSQERDKDHNQEYGTCRKPIIPVESQRGGSSGISIVLEYGTWNVVVVFCPAQCCARHAIQPWLRSSWFLFPPAGAVISDSSSDHIHTPYCHLYPLIRRSLLCCTSPLRIHCIPFIIVPSSVKSVL